MKPIKFPEMTVTWAKDQPEYNPLPAFSNEHETISLWRLSWWERIVLLFSGRIWLRQMNFGEKLQPQLLQLEHPFIRPKKLPEGLAEYAISPETDVPLA